jgi:hypothetical protein
VSSLRLSDGLHVPSHGSSKGLHMSSYWSAPCRSGRQRSRCDAVTMVVK